MELVLVRHAESIWNAEHRWQGQTDVPLSDKGRAEAGRLAARIASERFDRVVSSDLTRALDTARAAGFEPEPVRELREMDLGAWCGRPHLEVARDDAAALRELAYGNDVRIEGGETLGELEERVISAVLRLARESAGQRVAAFTHGGVVRAILLRALGLRGRYRPLVGVSNTSISVVHVSSEGTIRLARYNDATHLGEDHAPDDEVLPGQHARAHVARALGLASDAMLVDAEAETSSRLVPHDTHVALRSYAVPHPR